MKLLTNLPFDSFEPREAYRRNCPDLEILTYGAEHRSWVDGTFYPADVCFDPGRGSVHDLLAALPHGFEPDLLLIYWPDQDPIPIDLHLCPVPVVGVISDYNLTLPYTAGLWPFFDALVVDRGGVELFERLSFQSVRDFCQFSFKSTSHRLYDDEVRNVDVGFAGNLNPIVQPDRIVWSERLRGLEQQGLAVQVQSGIHGEDCGRFLNRCHIGFNRSVRREMNLRAFEVPACGALLFMEEDNLEVRDFFEPDEECVLYNDDNFEELVQRYSGDKAERHRIAAAGHRRVQDYSMSQRLPLLLEALLPLRLQRTPATTFERALGRGTSLLSTWARDESVLLDLVRANKLEPDDARAANALAVALVTKTSHPKPEQAFAIWQSLVMRHPGYVPAKLNLAMLLDHSNNGSIAQQQRDAVRERLQDTVDWHDLDGVLMTHWCAEPAVALSRALQEAVRVGDPAPLAAHWA